MIHNSSRPFLHIHVEEYSDVLLIACYIYLYMYPFPVIGDIIEDPVDTVVQAPDPLTLTCTASGVPQPDVTWTKTLRDGSNVQYTTSADNVNITNTYVGVNVTSTLAINPTDRNFTANYSCRASNFIGNSSESSQAQVIIAGNLCHL